MIDGNTNSGPASSHNVPNRPQTTNYASHVRSGVHVQVKFIYEYIYRPFIKSSFIYFYFQMETFTHAEGNLDDEVFEKSKSGSDTDVESGLEKLEGRL